MSIFLCLSISRIRQRRCLFHETGNLSAEFLKADSESIDLITYFDSTFRAYAPKNFANLRMLFNITDDLKKTFQLLNLKP